MSPVCPPDYPFIRTFIHWLTRWILFPSSSADSHLRAIHFLCCASPYQPPSQLDPRLQVNDHFLGSPLAPVRVLWEKGALRDSSAGFLGFHYVRLTQIPIGSLLAGGSRRSCCVAAAFFVRGKTEWPMTFPDTCAGPDVPNRHGVRHAGEGPRRKWRSGEKTIDDPGPRPTDSNPYLVFLFSLDPLDKYSKLVCCTVSLLFFTHPPGAGEHLPTKRATCRAPLQLALDGRIETTFTPFR